MNQLQIIFEILHVDNFCLGVELDILESVIEQESVGWKRTGIRTEIDPDKCGNVIGS